MAASLRECRTERHAIAFCSPAGQSVEILVNVSCRHLFSPFSYFRR